MRRERESAQKILDYTRQRMQAGYELPIEVTRAQLTAAQVEQRMAQLEDQDETASGPACDFCWGSQPDQPIEVAAEDIPAGADQTINDLVERGAAQQLRGQAGRIGARDQRSCA